MSRRNVRFYGFTLIELLMVIAVIIILVSVSMPLLSKLAQSNKRSQAVNLATAYISNARALAIQQRRPAACVFYEQTAARANPANPNQTAVILAITDPGTSPSSNGNLVFIPLPQRQPDYMPYGIRVAAISDAQSGGNFIFRFNETTTLGSKTRAIVFDGNGNLLLRNGLAIVAPSGSAGSATMLVGDWNFISGVAGPASGAASTPGILIYDYREFIEAKQNVAPATDLTRRDWILANSDVVAVNAYTGNILR